MFLLIENYDNCELPGINKLINVSSRVDWGKSVELTFIAL